MREKKKSVNPLGLKLVTVKFPRFLVEEVEERLAELVKRQRRYWYVSRSEVIRAAVAYVLDNGLLEEALRHFNKRIEEVRRQIAESTGNDVIVVTV
jgi:Arc/MetJ-type ribon-helix-helix transcriptional regulator